MAGSSNSISKLKIPTLAKSFIMEKWGISELYPPQKEALKPVLNGENTLISIPTASGKSLIAYLGIIQNLLQNESTIYRARSFAQMTTLYTHYPYFNSWGHFMFLLFIPTCLTILSIFEELTFSKSKSRHRRYCIVGLTHFFTSKMYHKFDKKFFAVCDLGNFVILTLLA